MSACMDMILSMDVMLCIYGCDDVSMDVLDLDVYMDVLYIVCLYKFCNSSCVGYTILCNFFKA
jgi:hypothetical protein